MKIRLRQFPFFLKLKPKLVISISLIFIIIIAMIETFIYMDAIPREINNAIEFNKQEVQAINERVEETLSLYTLLMNGITMDGEVQEILKTDYKSSIEELPLNLKLEKAITTKNIISSDKFLSVFIYDNWKLRYKMNLSPDYEPRFLKLNKYMYKQEGEIVWQVDRGEIYIHRAIRDKSSLQIIGYITMMVNTDYWVSKIQSASHRYTYVYNENELFVVQAGHDFAYVTASPLILSKSKRINNGVPTIVSVRNSNDMLLTTYKSSTSLWRVSSIVSLSELTQGTRVIGLRIIEIGLLGILVGCLALWLICSFMFSPLKELINVMKSLEQDNFNLRVDIKSNDEFGMVAKQFNRMMDKINYLITDVYDKEIRQKEAEYRALKAQINPHFLYNTLETIRLLCSFGENSKAESATVALAKLLKSSISGKNKEFITVREELGIVNAYLTIQNMRFQNNIEVSVHVDNSLMPLEIPRFILQPIIENAYQHGLENKIASGHLIVNGFIDSIGITFQVIDDGVGMDDGTLNELFSENASKPRNRSGTGNGLMNVQQRIKLLCGESFGLTVRSAPGIGTTVEILLPRGR